MKSLLLLLFFLFACKSPSVEQINPIEKYLQPVEKTVVETREEYLVLVNDYRHLKGLISFIYSPELEDVAQEFAQKMAQDEVPFGHTDADGRCETLRTQLGPADLCGEIIAQGPRTPEEVFNAWRSSLTEESKLSSSHFTNTGLGLATSSSGVNYWVQIFLEVL